MTHTNEIKSLSFSPFLAKRMLLGAIIGLTLIAVFLSGTHPRVEWGRFWMVKPLVIVPLAAASGAAFFHFMGYFRSAGGWQKIVVNIFCFFAFLIALYIGTILGLDGTLWN